MTHVSPLFSRFVSRDTLNALRLEFRDMAGRMKADARLSSNWDFFLQVRQLHRRLTKLEDETAARAGNLRSYANRAVYDTWHYRDAAEAHAQIASMLKGNLDGITVDELLGYIAEHIDELDIRRGLTSGERAAMRLAFRQSTGEDPTPRNAGHQPLPA